MYDTSEQAYRYHVHGLPGQAHWPRTEAQNKNADVVRDCCLCDFAESSVVIYYTSFEQ